MDFSLPGWLFSSHSVDYLFKKTFYRNVMAFVETTFNILYAIIYIPVSTLEMGPLPIGKITLRTLWRSLKPMESSLKLEYTRCFISTFIPVLAYSMYVEFELYNIR